MGMLFSSTYKGSSDFSYAAAPVIDVKKCTRTQNKAPLTLDAFDDDIRHTIPKSRRRTYVQHKPAH